MTEKGPSEMPINPVDWDTYLLSKIDQVTDEQRLDLEAAVMPELQASFAQLPEDRKLILTALNSLTDKEKTALINYRNQVREKTENDPYLVGIHGAFYNLDLLLTYRGKEITDYIK